MPEKSEPSLALRVSVNHHDFRDHPLGSGDQGVFSRCSPLFPENDPIDHLEERVGTGFNDVGADAAAAHHFATVICLYMRFTLRVLADAHATNLEIP